MNESFPIQEEPVISGNSQRIFGIKLSDRLTDEDAECTKRAVLLLVDLIEDATRRAKHGQFGVRIGRNRSKLGMIRAISEIEC